MRETGILFTPENHRAILNKTKIQTRRVIKPQPTVNMFGTLLWTKGRADSQIIAGCPYGRIGDKLYVREGIQRGAKNNPIPSLNHLWRYRLDNVPVLVDQRNETSMREWAHHAEGDLRTAMFMPKWAARTWLELTDVRIEKLQDISEEDSIAEGVSPQIVTEQDIQDTFNGTSDPHIKELARILGPGQFTAKFKYQELWDSINKVKHPWKNNDFVWCLSFTLI